MAEWIVIVVAVDDARAEDVAAELAARVEAAAGGAQLRDDGVVFWAPLDEREQALAAAQQVASAFGATATAQPAVPEEQWRDAWKRYFRVSRVTRRIVIVPSWERYAPEAGDVVLDLDPGQAFGTGTHASTRLCLDELDDLDAAGARVTRLFDLGTGSGILAIAAAKLWPACTCVATDVDPIAVRCARENAERNGVLDRLAISTAPIDDLDEAFPLVLANIQAEVHLALREAMIARVAPGGTLILSGLLTSQADEVARAFVDAGLRLAQVRPSAHDPAWSSVRLERPA